MNDISPRKIKTGGDPRTLSDYTALRDELSKLTHPARPDVNWRYAEKLCLSLFEQNGVELQTAAWYTLARTQLAGLFGLNEGLTILEALISHQWGALWPQPVHARMEILSSLSQRLQQRMRSLPLNYSDLSQLYRAEQLLTALGVVLQRLELKHLSQLDTLRTQMHNSAVRLENSDNTTSTGPNIQLGVVLPATVMNGATASTRDFAGGPDEDTSESAVKWVYVAQPEPQPNVEVLAVVPTPLKKWKSFAAGMCTMLVVSVAAVWGRQHFHQPDPLQTQLAASLAPLAATLTPEQLDMLRQQVPLPQDFITQTQQQLARLDKLPPDWNIAYSRKLIKQAQALWPEQAKPLTQQWQQQVNVSALSTDAMNGWHEGMLKLQELTTQLNTLDRQKGKYITVSELKSQVFAATQAFSKTVPVEEQLRQMSIRENSEMIPSAQKIQTELRLKQLITSYSTVTAGQ
ncbi:MULTISPECIES: VasL domain-containing protein [Citrobacter]|uniref:VasL domain-containing protein n=1 Tax=Citrobacter TaxID=544 RepID=UPI0012998BD6|nr:MULTISPECIES: VasL domain-containing protein [Citrobacter]MBJ9523106.1 type VI secretion system ImpA family N-terminal domain-containing protein [Citrobacter braakii]MDE9581917.1 type VI secretion system ImpA family N-terminal domain-containing protein [Citrobacter braakii]MEB8065545.1 type VI secretion system ImpA family N-terminal domain-containing protein [Citrobacter braakii]MRE78714.1 hypothetical protein [Citrobacter braakii]NMR47241.1 hypothetical protein [Citrobacter braakii]